MISYGSINRCVYHNTINYMVCMNYPRTSMVSKAGSVNSKDTMHTTCLSPTKLVRLIVSHEGCLCVNKLCYCSSCK